MYPKYTGQPTNTPMIETLPPYLPPEAQRPNEPALWHKRLLIYLELGTGRSVAAVEQAVIGRKKKGTATAYSEAAKKWEWAERAKEWDELKKAGSYRPAREEIKTETEESVRHYAQLMRKITGAETEEDLQKLRLEIAKAKLGKILLPALFEGYKTLFGEKLKLDSPKGSRKLSPMDADTVDSAFLAITGHGKKTDKSGVD